MIRTLAVAAVLALSTGAQAALTQPGDLAFTAFNADEDGFAFVALAPIGPGTAVYFTDNEWPGGHPGITAFSTGESSFRWVSGDALVPAGTVVRFSAIDKASRAASIGTLSLLENASVGFAATGDTLYAYTGVSQLDPLVFLAAVSTEGFAGNDLAGTGLLPGRSAVAITAGADFGEYTGARTGQGTFADYAALVNDPARWTAFATGNFAQTAPDVTAFAIGTASLAVPAVPEPETYAMLLAGLGLVGWRLQRRRERGVPVDGGLSARWREIPAPSLGE